MFSISHLSRRWTKFCDFTGTAIRPARVAAPPSVPDEPVAEQRPLIARHELHQLLLDFFRLRFFRQTETVREARDVRVHDHSDVDAKRISQNDVCGFSSDAAKLNQCFHRARNFAAVLFDERTAARLNVFRFVAEKTGGLDELLQLWRGSIGVIRRRADRKSTRLNSSHLVISY